VVVTDTYRYRLSVREDIRANALDPPRIQNPGLKLCLMPGAHLSYAYTQVPALELLPSV
jgi:hypothetical protein